MTTSMQPIITQEEKIILTYDEYEIWNEKPDYYDRNNDAYADNLQFYCLQTYEEMGEILIEVAQKISQYACCYWRIEGRNMGWLHRSGSRYVELPYGDMGAEMIRSFAPSGDFKFKMSKGTWQETPDQPARAILVVNCAHHDSPRGGEMLYLIPLTTQEWERENGEE